MSSKKKVRIAAAGVAVSLGLTAAAPPSFAGQRKTHVIKAQHIAFTPSHLSIRRGDRVTWKFLDGAELAAHTVTSEGPRRFKDSPKERLSGSFTATFSKPGSYRFQCTIHPGSMNGVITVR